MAMIEVTGGESSGEWEPLPAGKYAIQIDKAEPTTSKAGNPSLKVAGHVFEGPREGKKVVIWYSRKSTAVWKIANLLEAAIPGQYERVETGQKDEKGREEVQLRFDPDELEGVVVLFDVTVGTNPTNGNPKNDFNNEAPYVDEEDEEDEEEDAAAAGDEEVADDGEEDEEDEEEGEPAAAKAKATKTKAKASKDKKAERTESDSSSGQRRVRRRRRTA